MSSCDILLVNAAILDPQGKTIEEQAIALKKDRIVWSNHQSMLPPFFQENASELIDCKGKLVTPGLIDCHTHIVYAGNRAAEFKLRMQGASYTDIAKAGGGIMSTVRETRKASEKELLQQALPRLYALAKEGVTTVEIKSGYGLDIDSELKMLRVGKMLGEKTGLRVKTTFLGAHAVPPEFSDAQSYVDFLCKDMLPEIAQSGLADAVDVFCESIGFTLEQTRQIYTRAVNLSLPVKCHAEQLSNIGASFLAANFGALSCDHLEHLDKKGIEAMASAGTVAVLLPGAFYFLKEQKKPPVDLLRHSKVGIAIATDCNPGTSPTTSLLLMLNMACQFFGLTVSEALAGVTYQAARALGIEKETGVIAEGMAADLNIWDVKDAAELCYYFSSPITHTTLLAGKRLQEECWSL